MKQLTNLWNVKNLEPPVISTYKVTKRRDLTVLWDACREAVEFFGSQRHFEAESALLSRCIYRMKMKFRSDKGFKSLTKLNRCLLQYLRMNFVETLTVFHDLIPKRWTSSDVYLPSRNLLDFILVRLQGLAMLLRRIIETSQLAACFMENKILIGDYWRMAFLPFSIVSRLWVITKNMILFCYRFYSSILRSRQLLKVVGYEWLPSHYRFPNNLENWTLTNQIDDESVTNQINEIEKDEINPRNINNFNVMLQDDDVGQVVQRRNKPKLTERSIDVVLRTINSTNELKLFMKKEMIHRNNRDDCVSGKLDKLQWHMLDRLVKKYIRKADANKLRVEKYLLKAKDVLKISLS